jgi:hypothetical protein
MHLTDSLAIELQHTALQHARALYLSIFIKPDTHSHLKPDTQWHLKADTCWHNNPDSDPPIQTPSSGK